MENPASHWSPRTWLWVDDDVLRPNQYAAFQTTIEVSEDPLRAWLAWSADTLGKVFLNGRMLSFGPARESPPYYYYEVVDLAPYLLDGDNTLTLQAHYCGIAHASNAVGAAGVQLAGEIVFSNEHMDLGDPRNWRCRRLPNYRSESPRLTVCLGFSEDVDLRANAQAAWTCPVAMPLERGSPRRAALAPDLPPMLVETFAETVQRPLDGGTLIDMQREVLGHVTLDFDLPQPASIELHYAEALSGGRVDSSKGGAHYFDRLHGRAGRNSWTSFDKRAVRYAWVCGPARVRSFTVESRRYPLVLKEPGRARGESFEAKVRRISARTVELCSEDLLTDCPWRERGQYTDVFFAMGATKRLFGTIEPVRRFLVQMARGGEALGRVPSRWPSGPDAPVIPDFIITYILGLREFLRLGGEPAVVEPCFGLALNSLRGLREYEDTERLLANVPRWVFLDNSFEIAKQPRSSALNAAYAGGHEALAEVARALRRSAEAEALAGDYAALRQAWRARFLTRGRLYDADSAPEHERWRYLNVHYPATTGDWTATAFLFRARIRWPRAGALSLRLACFGAARIWLDGRVVWETEAGGGWERPPLFNPFSLDFTPERPVSELVAHVGHSPIEGEFFLGSERLPRWENAQIAPAPAVDLARPGQPQPVGAWRACEPAPYCVAPLSQVSVGYAAYHGMFEPDEARRWLTQAMPEAYAFNLPKRTTPLLARFTSELEELQARVIPANTPCALYFLCHGLKRYGREPQARALLRKFYTPMIEGGAETWWEEFNDRSSLCHQWGSFIAEFF